MACTSEGCKDSLKRNWVALVIFVGAIIGIMAGILLDLPGDITYIHL